MQIKRTLSLSELFVYVFLWFFLSLGSCNKRKYIETTKQKEIEFKNYDKLLKMESIKAEQQESKQKHEQKLAELTVKKEIIIEGYTNERILKEKEIESIKSIKLAEETLKQTEAQIETKRLDLEAKKFELEKEIAGLKR